MTALHCYLAPAVALNASLFELADPWLGSEKRKYIRQLRSCKAKKLSLCGYALLALALSQQKPDLKPSTIQRLKSGKPVIENGPCFSLSHSQNLVSIALCDRPIGLDIEKNRLASSRLLGRLGCDQKNFMHQWCARESVIKAADYQGSLKAISAVKIEKDTAQFNGQTWHLYPFLATGDYHGCMAASKNQHMHFYHIDLATI